MKQLSLSWSVHDTVGQTAIVRYCAHCGQMCGFSDSGKVRRNAHGKNIHEFRLFHCDRGHVWKKKIRTAKATDLGKQGIAELKHVESADVHTLHLGSVLSEGYESIQIRLEKVVGKHRLDSVLSSHFDDISRTILQKLIVDGLIRVNGDSVPPKTIVKEDQVITMMMYDYAALRKRA